MGMHGIQGPTQPGVVQLLWRDAQHQIGTSVGRPFFHPVKGHGTGESVADQGLGYLAMPQVPLFCHRTGFINDIGQAQYVQHWFHQGQSTNRPNPQLIGRLVHNPPPVRYSERSYVWLEVTTINPF